MPLPVGPGSRPPAESGDRPFRRAKLQAADLLLPLSIALWALGVNRTHTAAIGQYGLPAALPLIFYLGLGLLVVSAAIELSRGHPSRLRMSLHAAALVIMLYATAPLVYSEGRYAWLYKTIGVVQYINANGQLDRHIDIYQNWPGFFALAAWFGKVAGVASPLAYAKWAQVVFELAALPLLYLIYDALSLTERQRWLALLLYTASNWIGQDYFSPQALGTLLTLGIMAIAIRWLYRGNRPKSRSSHDGRDASADDDASQRPPQGRGRPALVCLTLLFLYAVLTFTHELSPYIVVVQLGALVLTRLLRPRWLPLALAVIAIGYLLPRFSYVNTNYGLLNSVGNFFRNAAPPSFAARSAPESQLLIEHCAEGLSVGMWALAIAGAWIRRRTMRPVLGLVILAFSPFAVLALQHYGDEGTLRAYLFSLPWTAALAASALVSHSARRRGAHAVRTSFLRPQLAWGTLVRSLLALAFALTLFFPAFFGDDSFNVMPQAEVSTVTSFLETARGGPIYSAIANAPLSDTSRYNLFFSRAIFGTDSLMGKAPVEPDIAAVLANNALFYTHGKRPAYVLVAPTMIAYSQAYGVTPLSSFTILLRSLAQSSAWKLVVSRAGTVIYELPPSSHAG
jgi:hypothetical protein